MKNNLPEFAVSTLEQEVEAARATLAYSSIDEDKASSLATDLSYQYWSSSCLNYEDRLSDGFYEVHGEFPEASISSYDFPSLQSLRKIAPKPNKRREVLLFNSQEDLALVQLLEDARYVVDKARSVNHSDVMAAYRALSQVVAGHLGGPQSNKTAIVDRWASLINDMKLKHSSVVIPIGWMYLGTARHRAILFKFLADQVDLPARVVKGKFYADDEHDAQLIIYVDTREMVVDLMILPGTVYPLEEKLSLRASIRERSVSLPEPVPENQELVIPSASEDQRPTQNTIGDISLEEAMQMAAAAALSVVPSAAVSSIPDEDRYQLHMTNDTTAAGSNLLINRFDGQMESHASKYFSNDIIDSTRASIPSPFETTAPSLGVAGAPELFEAGPAALISDASGQQYIVQPVRASLDMPSSGAPPMFNQANTSHASPQPAHNTLNSAFRDSQHDIVQWTASHMLGNALSTSMDKFSSWLSAQQPISAESSHADITSTVSIPITRQSSGMTSLFSQPHSYAETIDVGKLYLEGLQQHGSVRASVPIEFEQRQALLSREAAADFATRGNSIRDNSPPPSDAKPGSHSSGDKIPFPSPERPRSAQKSVANSLRPIDGTTTRTGSLQSSAYKEDGFRPHAVHAKSTADLYTHQSPQPGVARIQKELSATAVSGASSSHVSVRSFDGIGFGMEADGWEIDPEEIQLGPRIGIGSYGEVFRGQWRQTDVAVKILLDQEIDQRVAESFCKEVSLMKRLRHPNILQFIGACTQSPNLCIVTEFMPRGSLYKMLHRSEGCQVDDKRKIKMALDIARGMNYLHTCRPPIIHRDLKSPNLLVDKDLTIKVCDFGLSRVRKSTVMSAKSHAGTPEWTAPEVLRSSACNEASDVYSFGVILWELLTEKEPWAEKTAMQVVGSVGFGNERLVVPDTIRPRLRDLLHRCFGEPENRPSFSEIIPILKGQLMELVAGAHPPSSSIPISRVDASTADIPDEAKPSNDSR